MYLGECRQPPTRLGNNQLMANDLIFGTVKTSSITTVLVRKRLV